MKKSLKKIMAGALSLMILSGTLFMNCGNVSASSGTFEFTPNDDGTYNAYYITKAGEKVRSNSLEKVLVDKENLKTYLDIYVLLGKGDVNGDGNINLTDAKMTLKAALGIIELSEKENEQRDLMSTGEKVDLRDAYYLLRATLGITVKELPVVP